MYELSMIDLLWWVAGLMFWSGYAFGIGVEILNKPKPKPWGPLIYSRYTEFGRNAVGGLGGLSGGIGGVLGGLFRDVDKKD